MNDQQDITPRCPNHPDTPIVATMESDANGIMRLACPICDYVLYATQEVWRVWIGKDKTTTGEANDSSNDTE